MKVKCPPISAHKHRHSNKTTVHQETFIYEISAEEFPWQNFEDKDDNKCPVQLLNVCSNESRSQQDLAYHFDNGGCMAKMLAVYKCLQKC
jgi:hypothetical protein